MRNQITNNQVCVARWQDVTPLFAIIANTYLVSPMPQTVTKRRDNKLHATRDRWELRTVLQDQ